MGITIGINQLDQMLNGFCKPSLTLVGARPGMGKTAFAINMAIHNAIERKKTIAYFSLELERDQLVQRMLAQMSGIDLKKLKQGILKDEDWKYLTKATEDIFKTNIFIDDSAVLTIDEIKETVKKLKKEQCCLDLVIIDYFQLMERHTNDFIELVDLAKECNCQIVILSQLNKDLEYRKDKRPMISDLRGIDSRGESYSGQILSLYRDEVYEDTNDTGTMEIRVLKNRSGEIGTVKVQFDRKSGKISEI